MEKKLFEPFSWTSKLRENTQRVQNSAAVTQDNLNSFIYQNICQVVIIFLHVKLVFPSVTIAPSPFNVFIDCLIRIIATFPPPPVQNQITVLQMDLDTAEDGQELNDAIINFFIL